jgi:KDO2-lipid IV(A) lauroyltransferase
LQYRLWQVVTAVVGRLPARVSYLAASLLGSAAYYCWPRGRRAMHANYRRVLRGAPAGRIRQASRRSLANYCCYLADFARFPALAPTALARLVEGGESFAGLDRALERGKGALIVCMHFGNWDLGAGAAAARGYPLTVVAETFPDRRLDDMVTGARRRPGVQIVKMEKAGPSLLRALKNNGLLALLIDRPVPGEGVRVSFFGEEVEVPAGPARLALRSGAAVIPAGFARTHANREGVTTLSEFVEPSAPSGDDATDVRALTQAIMAAHERFIRAYPEQWYMFRPMWGEPAGSSA